jgi:hypothetical protein
MKLAAGDIRTGYVEIDVMGSLTFPVDSSRANRAYATAVVHIQALLERYASAIEVEKMYRQEWMDSVKAKRDAEKAKFLTELAWHQKQYADGLAAERSTGFWRSIKDMFVRPSNDFGDITAIRDTTAILRISSKIEEMEQLPHLAPLSLCSEELRAINLLTELEAKRDLAWIIEGPLILTSADAIELARVEDGTVVEQLEKAFEQMALRHELQQQEPK